MHTNNIRQADSELTLLTLVQSLWEGKWVIGGASILAALLSVYFTFKMPNLYTAEAVLSPTSSSSAANIGGQLGGLASLAGFSLPSEQGNRTDLAIELLQSRRFAVEFIKRHQIEVSLIAANGWSHKTNTLSINEAIYDINSSEWVRDAEYPFTKTPADWELFQRFSEIYSIIRDPQTSIVTLSVQYYSPYLAAQWAKWLVEDINNEMRNRDRLEAKNSIEYLMKEIENTEIASMRETFFSLVEEQIKTTMLTEVNPDYAFTVIDPPVAIELKSAPRRSLIVLAIVFLTAFITSVFYVVYRASFAGNRKGT